MHLTLVLFFSLEKFNIICHVKASWAKRTQIKYVLNIPPKDEVTFPCRLNANIPLARLTRRIDTLLPCM